MSGWLGIAERTDVRGDAIFSKDRRYRYTLERRWTRSESDYVLFIGLNPSTADAEVDDPTIRRMAQFAHRWGYGGMTVCNVFAFRATDPRELKRAARPVGPRNNEILLREAQRAALIVICWGNHGAWQGRAEEMLTLLHPFSGQLRCFGATKFGEPRHPLYLRRSEMPIAWSD